MATHAGAARPHIYAMDPTTTLFTFMLKTHPSVRTVHLLGSWDNFAVTYAMERDSRRDRGQWRGCHTCKDIICDGQEASHLNQTPRNGGLKMGHTYYYYYELDGQTEVHDPAVPSTTACPYLPGQRVNTLWVPVEKSARQRSASVNSLRHDDFRTMNPADRYVTPRPPPATPSAVPAVGSTAHVLRKKPTSLAAAAASAGTAAAGSTPNPLPSPRLLRRHRAGARSLSPASSWPTWSPRRLFVRRPSPSGRRDVLTAAAADGGDDDAEETAAAERNATNESGSWEDEQMRQTIDDEDRPRDDPQQQELRPPLPPRSSSTASLSSLLSRFGRQSSTSTNATNHAAAPATAAALSSAPPSSSPAASQGSRSRDISPESLRRLLVDDGPLESAADSRPESRLAATPAATIPCILEGIDENDDAWSNHDLDDVDDDEHNFAVSAVSAVSENAPFTVLSPPPPQTTVAAMPVATPPSLPQKPQEQQQQQQQQQQQTNEDGVHLSAPEAPVDELVAVVLPAPPTRAPPMVPTLTLSTVSAMASAEDDRIDDHNDDLDNTNTNANNHHQSTFSPSVLAPTSPSPASSPLSSLPSLSSLSFAFAESHGLSSPSETTTDDEDDDVDDEPDVFARTDDSGRTTVHDPWALSWPLPTDYLSCRDAHTRGDHDADDHDHDNGSSSSSNNNGDKADVHDRQHQQHHHLVAAALSGSTATLVPNNSLHAGAGGGANGGSGLHDLVDELGWMATAIQG